MPSRKSTDASTRRRSAYTTCEPGARDLGRASGTASGRPTPRLKLCLGVLCALSAAHAIAEGSTLSEPSRISSEWAADRKPIEWLADHPHTVLANDHLMLTVADPSAERGYNRASRFDRAGMVVLASTRCGRDVFGPLSPPEEHDPSVDDHVAGTAGEFSMKDPPGFDESMVGGTFVKIGVGRLRRPDDRDYFFRRAYEIVDHGRWTIDRGPRSVVYRHELDAGEHGIAYAYTTEVSLDPDAARFEITRRLTNIGEQRLATSYYNHHFVRFDDKPLGPGHAIDFSPAHRPADPARELDRATFAGSTFKIDESIGKRAIFFPLALDGGASEPWTASYRPGTTDPRLVIGHRPSPGRVVIYAKTPYLSVEPFIDIDLSPNDSVEWVTTYDLSGCCPADHMNP